MMNEKAAKAFVVKRAVKGKNDLVRQSNQLGLAIDFIQREVANIGPVRGITPLKRAVGRALLILRGVEKSLRSVGFNRNSLEGREYKDSVKRGISRMNGTFMGLLKELNKPSLDYDYIGSLTDTLMKQFRLFWGDMANLVKYG